MAQAIRNKDVRKNCIDVENIILECHSEPEKEDIQRNLNPIKTKKLNKRILKFALRYDANHRHELIPINQVKQNLVYKNYTVY